MIFRQRTMPPQFPNTDPRRGMPPRKWRRPLICFLPRWDWR